MRIAVNTRLLLPDKMEGIGWFAYETLKRITTSHPEHTFFFLFDRPWDPRFIFSSNITPLVCHPQARHPVLYYLWFNFSVPHTLRRIKPDLFLSPDGYLPLPCPCKMIPVFHDLNFEHYPENLPYAEKKYYRHFFPKFARQADRIATVSAFSKDDISSLYGISPEKIDVVYDGANDQFYPVDERKKEAIRNKYTAGDPYFVFVGAQHPRKNLANLFLAYDLFRNRHNKRIPLLIVGARKWWTRDIQLAFDQMKHPQDVIFTGRLHADELNDVLSSASALVFVSLFEGFGIPIVEAFRCGTPVLTSPVTSMPEVAGDAALYADPTDVASIADGLEKLTNDETLRNELIRKGFDRQYLFTWQQTADKLWSCIERTIRP